MPLDATCFKDNNNNSTNKIFQYNVFYLSNISQNYLLFYSTFYLHIFMYCLYFFKDKDKTRKSFFLNIYLNCF